MKVLVAGRRVRSVVGWYDNCCNAIIKFAVQFCPTIHVGNG